MEIAKNFPCRFPLGKSGVASLAVGMRATAYRAVLSRFACAVQTSSTSRTIPFMLSTAWCASRGSMASTPKTYRAYRY